MSQPPHASAPFSQPPLGYPRPPGTPEALSDKLMGATPWAAGPDRREHGGLLALISLVLGALLALAYAGWAFSARRAVFAEFAAGRSVTSSTAASSDRVDTTLLIVAGVVAALALVLWLVRRIAGKITGGGLDNAGLTISLVGAIAVLVGLWLAGRVNDLSTQVTQGRQAMTATIVVGAGFLLLAIGFVIGLLVARAGAGNDQADDADSRSTALPYQYR
ncbi:MAG: hypothetical protein ACR2KG_12945 [Nocardioidaceae bacterium]